MINLRSRCWRLVACALALALSACGSPNAIGVLPAAAPPTAAPAATLTTASPATMPVIPTLTSLPPTPTVPLGFSLEETSAQHIAQTLPGLAVVAGDYLVWVDTRSTDRHIRPLYGYDLRTHTEFVLHDAPGDIHALASNGHQVVWLSDNRILLFDLRTRQMTPILDSIGGAFADLALAEGIMFYHDTTKPAYGLQEYTLATGAKRRLSGDVRDPVVGDGKLLWNVWAPHGVIDSTVRGRILYLRYLDGSRPDLALSLSQDEQASFAGYNVAGDQIVWSFGSNPVGTSGGRISLYDIPSGRSTFLSPEGIRAFNPIITDDIIVWSSITHDAAGNTLWVLQRYNRDDSSTQVLVTARSALHALACLPGEPTRLLFTVDNHRSTPNERLVDLYLLDLE